MSIQPLAVDMKNGSDPTYVAMFKKINEIVGATNDDFKSIQRLNNELAVVRKELQEIKVRMMNLG
jgi:hypothetical protein